MKHRYVSIIAPMLVTVLSASVLIGWHTHNTSLIQVLPQFAPMQHNTALCFLLCALSLLCYLQKKPAIGLVFSLCTLGVSALTFSQYILNTSFGIDELFIKDYVMTKTSHAGRMAPNTAICFMLCSLSLAAAKKRRALIFGIAFSAFMLALISLMGYLFEFQSLYGWGNLTRMAIHTAVGFVLLSTGIMLFAAEKRSKHPFNLWRLAPISIGIMALSITGFSWYSINELNKENVKEHFIDLTQETTSVLKERYILYTQSLRGALGFFQASNKVERLEWRAYTESLKIEQTLPGINGVGYIDYVRKKDLPAYLAETRADNAPDFTNHPETHFEDKFIIKFIEPVYKNVEAIGLDIGFEANRREAAEYARDYGLPAITKKIELVQDHKKLPGFLFLLPVYDKNTEPQSIEERRSNFQGWVYAPFIGANFFDFLLNVKTKKLDLHVFDGLEIKRDNLIYASNTTIPNLKSGELYHQHIFEVGNRSWTFLWSPGAIFSTNSGVIFETFVAIFGFVFSVILYWALMRLIKRNEIIETIVENRTIEIRKTQSELIEANAELEEFAYRTSHDLRSPIISSIGLLGMITTAVEKGDKNHALQGISLASDSLKKLELLISDILALTKTKNLEEEEQEVDVNSIIDDAINKICNIEHFDKLDIIRNTDIDTPFLMKKNRFVLVVENLISNAAKYQDLNKDNAYIKITAYKENNTLLLSIQDNGLGIPENQQQNLFKMFHRFHPKSAVGSGLGLYMIKKSVDILGGTISYKDTGDGSLFQVSIPTD